MLLSEVGYARPATLEQALGVLAEYPGARALAGGQTLLAMLARLARSKGHKQHLSDLLDDGLKASFPASDPIAVGRFTGAEVLPSS